MSKRNRSFAGIIHEATMVKWIAFGYLLHARDNGIDIKTAAQTFCSMPLVNDEGKLDPKNVRIHYYTMLKRLLDARQPDSPEQGVIGDSSSVKTGV